MLHVVFARPQNHDGLARGLGGHLRRLHHEVSLVAAAESTAHERRVDDDFFGRELGCFRDDRLGPLWRLRGDPRFSAVRSNLNGTVHRFHAGMGSEGELVSGFDLLGAGGGERGIRVTVVTEDVSAFCSVCQISATRSSLNERSSLRESSTCSRSERGHPDSSESTSSRTNPGAGRVIPSVDQ